MKALLLTKAGHADRSEYALEEGKTYLVGRSREADIIVKDRLVSRNHCKLEATGADEWSVADLGSSNGTYVNRQRITTRQLKHGDAIYVGKTILEFRIPTATSAPTTVPIEVSERPGAREEPAPAAAEASAQPRKAQATAPPPPAAPAPPPPRPAAPPPQPGGQEPPAAPEAPKPTREPIEEDVRGFFEFLDRVDKGGPPEAGQQAARRGDEEPSEPKPPDETDGAPLFSLFDDVAPSEPERKPAQPPPPPRPGTGPPRPEPVAGQSQPQPPPPPQPPSEEGGLLGFLRKKRKPPS